MHCLVTDCGVVGNKICSTCRIDSVAHCLVPDGSGRGSSVVIKKCLIAERCIFFTVASVVDSLETECGIFCSVESRGVALCVITCSVTECSLTDGGVNVESTRSETTYLEVERLCVGGTHKVCTINCATIS